MLMNNLYNLHNYKYTAQIFVKCIFMGYYYMWSRIRMGKSGD